MSPNNAKAIRLGRTVQVGLWNGTGIWEFGVPAQNISVVFDYAWAGSSGTCNLSDHGEVVAALGGTGIRFINGPETASICGNKWSSYELFTEVGVDTPATLRYNHSNARSLIEREGLIFIKDVGMSEGMGQFTISDAKGIYVLKSDGLSNAFSDLGRALGVVDRNADTDACIVQEGIKMRRIGGRVYDFRAIFQLNGSGQIVLSAVYMRFGAKGSDQSNISNGGYPMDPALLYTDFSGIRDRIGAEGMKIFKGLQRRSNNVGEIGMDFLLSSGGRLTVLEINARPGTKGIRELAKGEFSNTWAPALQEVLRNPIANAQRIMETMNDV